MRNKNPTVCCDPSSAPISNTQLPTTTSSEEKFTFIKSAPRTMSPRTMSSAHKNQNPSAHDNLIDFSDPATPTSPPLAKGGSQAHTHPNPPFGHRDFAYTPSGHNLAQLSRTSSLRLPSPALATGADSMADTPGSSLHGGEQGAGHYGEVQGGAEKSRVKSWEEDHEEFLEDEYVGCVEQEGEREVSAAPGMVEERGITEDDRNAFAETVMYFERRITNTGNQAIRLRKDINGALEEMKREQERRSGMWSREQIDHLTGSIFSAFLVAACIVMLVAWATICFVGKI